MYKRILVAVATPEVMRSPDFVLESNATLVSWTHVG
jgi:hypothetical protein